VYTVSAFVFTKGDAATGVCVTTHSAWSVYQEHLISILYEIGLGVQFILYIKRNIVANISMPLLLKQVLDAEMYGFGIYFLAECIYLFVYTCLIIGDNTKGFLPLVNTLYLNVPVLLFFANALIVRSESHAKNKNEEFPSELEINR
jgi:hypothetical protein